MVIFDIFKGYSVKFDLVIRDINNLIYLEFDNIFLYKSQKLRICIFWEGS
jgi:hypothetical protein